MYSVRFFLYISRLKSRRKLPPGKERNGLRLAALRREAEWVFSQIIDACRASVVLSKHCLCHYNGAWLAFVSIALSKHRFCNDKPSCTSVDHSQQALLLDAHPLLACSCLRLLASIGFGHPKTSCLGVSQSEQALLLYIQKQLARLSATLCKHRGCNDVACLV